MTSWWEVLVISALRQTNRNVVPLGVKLSLSSTAQQPKVLELSPTHRNSSGGSAMPQLRILGRTQCFCLRVLLKIFECEVPHGNNGHQFKHTNNPWAEGQSAEAINAVHIPWKSEIQRHQMINKVHPYFTGAINATVTQGIAVITHIKNNYRVQTQILGRFVHFLHWVGLLCLYPWAWGERAASKDRALPVHRGCLKRSHRISAALPGETAQTALALRVSIWTFSRWQPQHSRFSGGTDLLEKKRKQFLQTRGSFCRRVCGTVPGLAATSIGLEVWKFHKERQH